MRSSAFAALGPFAFALVVSSLAACGGAPSAPEAPAMPDPPEEAASTSAGTDPAPSAGGAEAVGPDEAAAVEPEAAPEPPPVWEGPIFPEGSTVLVVGDSFSNSLGVGLKPILKEEGVRVVLAGKKSTFLPDWAGPSMGMRLEVTHHEPELVVIVLGGNELGVKDPMVRKEKIERVVAHAEGHPCVWVAPALWEMGDPHGMLPVLREYSKPCRYYDTNALAPDLPRGGDKIHPDEVGRTKWAEAFLSWLRAEREMGDSFGLKPRPADE